MFYTITHRLTSFYWAYLRDDLSLTQCHFLEARKYYFNKNRVCRRVDSHSSYIYNLPTVIDLLSFEAPVRRMHRECTGVWTPWLRLWRQHRNSVVWHQRHPRWVASKSWEKLARSLWKPTMTNYLDPWSPRFVTSQTRIHLCRYVYWFLWI